MVFRATVNFSNKLNRKNYFQNEERILKQELKRGNYFGLEPLLRYISVACTFLSKLS